jgi:hypothetical protein
MIRWNSDASMVGPVVAILVWCVVLWACAASGGCSLSRWEAEDGHSKVNHGLTVRFGTVFYIGDDRGGYTEADWTASGEQDKEITGFVFPERYPTTQPAVGE